LGLRSIVLSLRRYTSSGLYIPELDGLRFVAIFFVYVYHVSIDVVRHTPPGAQQPSSPLYFLVQQLNIGVPLFFAISGMILGLPFARYWLLRGPKVSLRRYFLRRVTRLEPPYIASLLLLFVVKYLGHRGTIAAMLPHLGASLVYLHNLIYQDLSTINPAAWSLEVEVQFYILAPILALVFCIRRGWLRRALISGAIVIMTFQPWAQIVDASRRGYVIWLAHLTLVGNIQYFLTGFLLADFFLLLPTSKYRNRWWDIATILGWPCFALMLVERPGMATVALPGIILLLYVGAFYGTLSSGMFGSLWVASIGGMCYSIYLLHSYTISTLGFLTERLGSSLPYEVRLLTQVILMTPIVLAISTIFYLAIEQPCMRGDWPKRLGLSASRKWQQITLSFATKRT
jgi:peptidoglycan/LPS O-acetylase OafA/YrhL